MQKNPKNVAILGSTGSIGTQTLDIIRAWPNEFNVVALTTHNNVKLLHDQIVEFKPKVVGVTNFRVSSANCNFGNSLRVIKGKEALNIISDRDDIDIVVNALVGNVGISATILAIKAGKTVALANKETLVSAGDLINAELSKNKKAKLIPIDSEHVALHHCLRAGRKRDVLNVTLTASGGPFRTWAHSDFIKITVEDALKHPTWTMGEKISVDSATMMNKGFEVIEAKHLFNLKPEQIKIVVHPQSIIHSYVEFKDHSQIWQASIPNMKLAIQYALFGGRHKKLDVTPLKIENFGNITFEKCNTNKFYCIELAYKALKIGGTMPTVLNTANDVLVSGFLHKEVVFLDIPRLIEKVMNAHKSVEQDSLETILEVIEWARTETNKYLSK